MTDPAAPLLIVTARWPAPSETFIRRDLVALRDAGVPFRLAALTGTPRNSIAGIEAGVLQVADSATAAVPGRNLVPRWLKQAAHPLRHRHLERQLYDYATAHGIRHLHAAHLDLPGYLVSRVARAMGCSFSLEGHARDVYCSQFDLAATCRGATHVSVCNEAARQHLAAQLSDGPEPLLIRHGFQQQPPCPSPVSRPCRTPLRIVFVGRLVEKKGTLDAITVAELVAKRLAIEVALTFIGDGPGSDPIRQAARVPGLNVKLAGWLEHDAVIHHLRHDADLLLLPARIADDGDRDGIPNVVLEAMANNLPVVAAAVGGIPEVVSTATGWPFPPGELETAAAAVQSLVADPEVAHRRCVAARERLATDFDPATAAATRSTLFQAALQHQQP